jgi:hypothetical protein
MASQASPVDSGVRVAGSLDYMKFRQLRVPSADLPRVCTNTCAELPYPSDSTSGYPSARGNSAQQDSHPRVQ